MSPSEAQKRASNKYNAEHMRVIGCKLKKEQAEAFKEHCKQEQTTPNEKLKKFVLSCISTGAKTE